MKTILCPVDFTVSSDHVAKYAAQLAHDTNAKVVLVAAHQKNAKVPAGDWPDHLEDLSDRLNELHDMLTTSFKAPCTVEEEVIDGNIYKKVSELADHYDMMISGMKYSEEGQARDILGLDLVKMIHETLAPFLIIPDNIEYKKISRLVYAYDYKHEPEPPLMQLAWLAEWFDLELTFVSVVPDNISFQEDVKIKAAQSRIKNEWRFYKKLSFETIVYDDVAKCLQLITDRRNSNDLLILSINHKNILDRLWHKSVIRQLLMAPTHPYLIIHK